MRQWMSAVAVAVLVLGTVAPVAGASGAAIEQRMGTASGPTTGIQEGGSNESEVSVGVGQQLSTVLAVTEDDVQTDVENRAFEVRVRDDEDALAERAEELRERAETIAEEYENATEAFEDGEISRSTYAQRLATLHARAENVARSHRRLRNRTAAASEAELEAAGLNRTALNETVADLDAVRGAGPAALLARFTGASDGEVELETRNGLEISAESEDGERSREIRRAGDDSLALTIPEADAFWTARERLSTQAGNWTVEERSVHPEDGEYRYEFALVDANATGEAEVRVDGSSGDIVRLEEEIERDDEEPEETEDDENNEGKTESEKEEEETEEETETEEEETESDR